MAAIPACTHLIIVVVVVVQHPLQPMPTIACSYSTPAVPNHTTITSAVAFSLSASGSVGQEIPWQHVLGFVIDDPLTMLACMMVNKTFRKSAGRLLNLHDSDMQHCCHSTLAHHQQFSNFLADPSVFRIEFDSDGHCDGAFGPIRSWAIKNAQQGICQ
jgi:hypothetical protein